MPSLQHREARARFDLLSISSYDVSLDLASDEATFPSTTVITFESRAGSTFLDLKATAVQSVRLDGRPLDLDTWAEGRLPLDLTEGSHVLEVVATMPFRNDGEGLHRSVDPADGRTYVYGMSFMSAAPSIFACFDQPDLKAPYTFHVIAPADWLVAANAPGKAVEVGRWEFEQSPPLSTYFVTLVAGPFHTLSDNHDGIELGLLARQSLARTLEAQADEILTITRQSFDELHRLFEVRYAFGKYDQAFVPEFNAAAMENPGCVTIRDPFLFTHRPTRVERLKRATTIAHEMAHQWFGDLITPRWWDDLWLNEAFAEYLGNRVVADATELSDAHEYASISRKNWGLIADSGPGTHPVAGNGASDADAALLDFDGISYAKGHALLTQLADRVGDDVFFGGLRDLFERHRFGNAAMPDVFAAWERAGADDLSAWTSAWLRTSGVDRVELDRSRDVLLLTSPTGQPLDRVHDLTVATWHGKGWSIGEVTLAGPTTPVDASDRPILLDPTDRSWADLTIDPVTARALPELLPDSTDPAWRASFWNTLRNGVHQVRLSPDSALGLVCAALPSERLDVAVSMAEQWTSQDGEGARAVVHHKLLPVVSDPAAARARLNAAFLALVAEAPAGSDLALAAFQGAVGSATDETWLRGVLAGEVPDGVSLDDDLRWRVLRRLATTDATTVDELDHELARNPSGSWALAHAWCRARLPLSDAKEWAWAHFTGEVPATNYELQAVGSGMWDVDQETLLAPYAERYPRELAATAGVRQGWVLGDAALWFFPITATDEKTLQDVRALSRDVDLDASLRRVLDQCTDVLARRFEQRRLNDGPAS